MEAQLFATLYRLVHSLAHAPRGKRQQFSDRWVVLVFLWSVLHHRPRGWACDARNWPKDLDTPLISPSRLSRRLRTVGVQQLLERALDAAAHLLNPPAADSPGVLVKAADSMPMTVGPYSHDPDAKRGRTGGGMQARGYRLHAVAYGRAVVKFVIASMNAHDAAVAPRLLSHLEGTGYLLADNAYDTNDLHRLAAARGHQLVSPPKRVNAGKRDVKHNCSERIRSLDLLDPPTGAVATHPGSGRPFGRRLYGLRQRIESGFGGLSSVCLGALPMWVRHPRRVALWAAGKILVYLVKMARNKGLTAMTQ